LEKEAVNDPLREPGLINKLYRNPRRGMIFGVCAGFAEYFGFDVTVTRVIVAVSAFFAFPIICLVYLLLGLMLPSRGYVGPEPDYNDPAEREGRSIRRQVRSSPHDTLASVRYRFRDLDVRLQRLEKYVTSNRYKLDREFRELGE
jgi:phage shock protein C